MSLDTTAVLPIVPNLGVWLAPKSWPNFVLQIEYCSNYSDWKDMNC